MTTWTVGVPSPNPETQKRLQWVADMMTASDGIAAKLKVTPQAIVAQAAQETGFGASRQGRFGLFGEKVSPNWKGLKVLCPTREWNGSEYIYIQAWFRDFNSYAECLQSHFEFLDKDSSRWHDAGVFDGEGDEHFFAALQKGGYATDPNYAANLLRVEETIEDYYLPHLSKDGIIVKLPPRILHIGDQGDDVRLVQDALKTQGFLSGVAAADGDFGPITREAVMKFQTTKHITVDGVVGDQTRKLLNI